MIPGDCWENLVWSTKCQQDWCIHLQLKRCVWATAIFNLELLVSFLETGTPWCNRTNELVLVHSNADTGITRQPVKAALPTYKLVKHTSTRMCACCNSKTTPQKRMFYYFCISRCETTPHNSHSPSHYKSTPDRHTHTSFVHPSTVKTQPKLGSKNCSCLRFCGMLSGGGCLVVDWESGTSVGPYDAWLGGFQSRNRVAFRIHV